MAKRFNTAAVCIPEKHYMVDITAKLAEIKKLIDDGSYFTINRARQYGKTTTLNALSEYLKNEYTVISLDFQRIGNEEFATANIFSTAFAEYLLETIEEDSTLEECLDKGILDKMLKATEQSNSFTLRKLFTLLSKLCKTSSKPIVLIIDEVDSATNNQVFLDFLAQLRAYYIDKDSKGIATFQSVILAGVYDVKNIKRKIRPDDTSKVNSPWNIAVDFEVNMSFSKNEIAGMLADYESDYHTGMDIDEMAEMLYDSTSGYPFLVSRLCQLIDEKVIKLEAFQNKSDAWTRNGFIEAEKMLLSEKNTLFESLIGKLTDYPELKDMLYANLFKGEKMMFNPYNPACELGVMFGFIKNTNGVLSVSNRTFETLLYNYFMSIEQMESASYKAASRDKNQFIINGMIDMRLVFEKFVKHFHDVYRDKDEKFLEEYGRKFFLLYLKPIINGTGHYYIEGQTRDETRTDVIVDYLGKQFVIELKIWNGPKYHQEGEDQLVGYLNRFHLDEGYLLTYNFTKKKQIGIVEVDHLGKKLIEVTV